jgi:NAD(P)-dependent dehydrogenase (short-subunit alcohol dehydrogenase family)
LKTDTYLFGRHAIVTGGGKGIGSAIAFALASRGASLTLLGRDMTALHKTAEKIRARHDSKIECHPLDVRDAASVAQAFAAALAPTGKAFILVNNAGEAQASPAEQTSSELWQKMIEVNLTGAFRCIQQVLPSMLAEGTGRIVNIASTAGLRGYPKISAYCAAKHGLIGLTRSLALEYAKSGITVNAVCPGYTKTEMLDRAIDEIVNSMGKTKLEATTMLLRPNPQARWVEPEEVAETVAWLCSPGAAAINGQSIAVAGGEVT